MAISTEDLARSYPVAVGVATAEQWPTEPGEGIEDQRTMQRQRATADRAHPIDKAARVYKQRRLLLTKRIDSGDEARHV